MKKSKLLKAWDIPLLFVLVCLAFSPLLFLKNASASEKVAILRVAGKQTAVIPLTKKATDYHYQHEDSYNSFEIKNQKIRSKKTNCPNQQCVQQGWIAAENDTIICVPHQVVVEIRTGGEHDH